MICLFRKQRPSWTNAFLQVLGDKDHLKHLAEQIKDKLSAILGNSVFCLDYIFITYILACEWRSCKD